NRGNINRGSINRGSGNLRRNAKELQDKQETTAHEPLYLIGNHLLVIFHVNLRFLFWPNPDRWRAGRPPPATSTGKQEPRTWSWTGSACRQRLESPSGP